MTETRVGSAWDWGLGTRPLLLASADSLGRWGSLSGPPCPHAHSQDGGGPVTPRCAQSAWASCPRAPAARSVCPPAPTLTSFSPSPGRSWDQRGQRTAWWEGPARGPWNPRPQRPHRPDGPPGATWGEWTSRAPRASRPARLSRTEGKDADITAHLGSSGPKEKPGKGVALVFQGLAV